MSLLFLTLVAAHGAESWAQDADMDSVDDVIDVDDDGDGLIEIATLTELDYIRNNLAGTAFNDGSGNNSTGCGDGVSVTTCNGYELVADLDFNTDTSDATQVIDAKDQFFNNGTGWVPLGEGTSFQDIFTGTFEGNGHQISNLFIDDPSRRRLGLFGEVRNAQVRNLTLNGDLALVSGTATSVQLGALAAQLTFESSVINCHSSVAVSSTAGFSKRIGGLIGYMNGTGTEAPQTGPILDTVSTTGSITINDNAVGGIVGLLQGGIVRNAYSTAAISGNSGRAAGLIAEINASGGLNNPTADVLVENSVSLGSLDTNSMGGLVARIDQGFENNGTITLRNLFARATLSPFADVGGMTLIIAAASEAEFENIVLASVINAGGNQADGLFIEERDVGQPAVIDDVFWDIEASTLTNSNNLDRARTTAVLRCPTSNSEDCEGGQGLFADFPSTVWDFGTDIQYPAIKIDGVALRDTDFDLILDHLDADDDNDGVPDTSDVCQFDPDPLNINTDGDSLCNANDLDDDNDGYSDEDENANGGQSDPLDENSTPLDSDGDFISNFLDDDDDNDGYSDEDENANGGQSNPLNAASTPPDNDGDFVSDFNDDDDDNDGYTDADENSNGGQSNPFSANSTPPDFDGDFVSDFNDTDDDDDGILDVSDNCPLDPDAANTNNDGDNLCDLADTDDDNDTILDTVDNCQFIENLDQADFDADEIGDVCDPDDDNDTVPDGLDNCPEDSDPLNINTDGDALCDTNDTDDDNDTVLDVDDNCDLIVNLDQANNDNDEFGDACDADDDNDGRPDNIDNCPFTGPVNQTDIDGDGAGNVCDVDEDGDQLIEIRTLAELNLMRDALDGGSLGGDDNGCSTGSTLASCIGYELRMDLDFNTDTSDAVQVIDDKDELFNGGIGWVPIGSSLTPFTGVFEGNNHSIANLFIANSDIAVTETGLFGVVENSQIRNLRLIGDLTQISTSVENSKLGTIAGVATSTVVEDVSVVGDLNAASGSQVGGLFGEISNATQLSAQFVRGQINAQAPSSVLAGLVAHVDGSASAVSITNSFANASIMVLAGNQAAGLLANAEQTSITNSYSGSAITGDGQQAGLVLDGNGTTTAIDSYWDDDALSQGPATSAVGQGKTTAQLQCVLEGQFDEDCEGGGGIYVNWLPTLWHFGASFQYPERKFDFVNQRDTDADGILDNDESDPDDDGFEFSGDNCPFDQDFANINSDDDDQCDGRDLDDDNDGYSDADENDNGTDTTDAGSTPPDNDGDLISDLNDPDDDNDGNLDTLDNCIFDADVANLNNDGDELCDTNDPDDDNDGVSDETEINAGLNPFIAEDPMLDSDGDGTPDLEEAQVGSDVFDASSTPLNAGAGFNEWNSTGPNGSGASILVADPSNSNTAYAQEGGEVYRTVDDGQNWRRITDNINPDSAFARFFGLAVDPNDSDTLYVSNPTSRDRVFKSVDSGETWQVMEVGLTIQPNRIIADPISSDILYAVDNQGNIFRTINAAVSWSARGQIPVIEGDFIGGTPVISPQNAAVLYIHSSKAVYVSEDGGVNWNVIDTGFGTNPSIRDIAVDPSNADVAYVTVSRGGIFKTIDRGQNWNRVDTGTPVDSLFPDKIVVDSSNPSIVYFMNGLGVYKSLNGGVNWSEMFNGLPDQFDAIGFTISQVDPSILYVSSTNKGVFLSEDGAASWQQADNGIHRFQIDKLRRIEGQNEVAFATRSTAPGVFSTSSAGARWDNVGDESFGRVFALAIDPSNAEVRYIGTDNSIFKTVDGADTWVQLTVPFLGAFDFIEVDRINPSVVYARGQNSTLIRSPDGGTTWLEANVGLPSFGFSDVGDLIAANDGVYFALRRSAGGVYKSTNQGALWFAVNNGDLVEGTRISDLEADFTNNRLFAITDNSVLTSEDAGANWATLDTAPSIDEISVDQEAPEILLGASFGNYYRSADGGVTWQDLPSIVRDGASSQLASGPAGSSVIYTGTARLGVHAMELATDLSIEYGVLEPQVVEGQNFTYRFTITNDGPYDESRAQFSQTFSPFADGFVGAVPSQGMCMPNAGAVECELGLIKVGESVQIDVEVNAERAGLLNSRVTASGYLSTLNAGNSDFIAQIASLADTDGDEIPDVDDTNDDNDNFPDANDNCPLIVNNSQADLDGDGQGDVCDADQDGDGISDVDEQRNGLDPRNPDDADLDFDNDGLNNRQEIVLRTDIRNPDTDGDGVDDGTEVANGTDPRRDESKPIPISAIINLLLD